MDLNEVAIFIKVIQKGSFTKAALALEMPKSTVSTKISNLEKRLGTTLITRSTRKLRLTPAGEAFFLRSTKAIEEINAAELAVRADNVEPQGPFTITASIDVGSAILPSLIADFQKKFPKVQIEVLLSDRNVDFLQDNVDLAIRTGDLKDSALIAKKLGEVSLRIFASPKYIKMNGVPSSVKNLREHVCVLFTPISSSGWQLKNGKRTVIAVANKKIVVNNMSFAHNLAVQGAGLALLPSFLCESDIKAGKLIPVLPEWTSEFTPIHFVYQAQRYVSPSIKAFIENSTASLRRRFGYSPS